MAKHNLRWRDSMEASRSAIFTVVGLNVVLIAMLALLLIREQRRLRENTSAQARLAERLESEVAKRTEELSSLSAFLQANSEREKAALARELHDELGGILTPAKMDLSWLQGHLGGDPACRERMQRLSHLIDEGIDLKRRIIESLRPSLLDHLGLAAALQWYVDETCKSANLDCKLNVPRDLERLPSDLEIALFRLVQESLNNIVKHARARHVDLSVERFAKGLRVGDRRRRRGDRGPRHGEQALPRPRRHAPSRELRARHVRHREPSGRTARSSGPSCRWRQAAVAPRARRAAPP